MVDSVETGFIGEGEMPTQAAGLEENDIEEVSVLQGEEAKTLNRENVANGVVLITTKK